MFSGSENITNNMSVIIIYVYDLHNILVHVFFPHSLTFVNLSSNARKDRIIYILYFVLNSQMSNQSWIQVDFVL